MLHNKIERQYRAFVAHAIDKSRKAANGRVAYASVWPQINEYTAFSFAQWAMSEGWLHMHGTDVYETKKTLGLTMSEVLHDLNGYKDDK